MTNPDLSALKIKDLVAFAKGKPPAEQPYFGTGAEVYLTPEYLRGGLASEPIKAHKNAARVVGGETIVLWDGSNAGEVFKAKAGVLSSTMVELQPDESFEADYFYYAMKGWEVFLKGQTSGSGIPHVDKEVIGKLDLLAFPKIEQLKIAEVLATVDLAIEQTEALIAKQQRIKVGLMQDLLTCGIDEQGQLRNEQTHAFKDSLLGQIPVEWEVAPIEVKLREIIDYRGRTPVKTDAGIPLITAKNVREGFLSEHPQEFIAEDAYEAWMTRGIPACGDVMLTTEAPMGNVARVPNYRIALAQRLITLPTNPDELSSDFLFWVLHWSQTLERLTLLTSGSTVIGVKQSVFRRVIFAFPELDEQLRIAKALDAEKTVADMNLKELIKLQSLKKALMQDLLSGNKRVVDLLSPEVSA
jgi:type I restriction enzyme S subunit